MASIKTYITESYNELINKVSWPSWAELQSSAVLVFVSSLIIALLVFLMDYVFGVNPGQDTFWKGVLGFMYQYLLK
jgi:preprotein translocase subunit SecE